MLQLPDLKEIISSFWSLLVLINVYFILREILTFNKMTVNAEVLSLKYADFTQWLFREFTCQTLSITLKSKLLNRSSEKIIEEWNKVINVINSFILYFCYFKIIVQILKKMFAALKAGKPMSEAAISNGINSVSNPLFN